MHPELRSRFEPQNHYRQHFI